MAGALRKTMVYLGLAEEDERYDGYDEYDDEAGRDDARGQRTERAERPHVAAVPEPETEHRAAVTPLPQRHTPVARVVRETEVGQLTRITTIHPRTYNEAKKIGEAFRDGTPVIMNLSDMADDDAKRLVDFAAGLIFGLHGEIERVTSKVFLLSPAHVEVSTEESVPGPRQQRGFFNQS
ncbi:cell division protein SepF [Lapillicoccus jejuensis]|uniref:Cell division protein SepF n=1 Tax=Lapillicoccus jejuensis TaxID=402171 RepID=A0A542E6Q8_9MICO|nr:cell division protein SepF [Lapillicoccus jejuensis]TQJ11021.1 cell division inhibitor SepF [Lapillicoccus jejuensis]